MGAALRVIQHGSSHGVKHLTDPQAKEHAYDLFVQDGLRCRTIADTVSRSRDIIELWASQGNWVELRRQFIEDKKAALTKKYGSPIKRAQAIYAICDRTTALVNSHLEHQLPTDQLRQVSAIAAELQRTQANLDKLTGLDFCFE